MIINRRPPVRHSPPLSRHSPPLPRHSETTEPRSSSETQTTPSNGQDIGSPEDGGRKSGVVEDNPRLGRRHRSNDGPEDEEDSKFPPAPPAVSMADSFDSKNGLGIFPQNPMHRDADMLEMHVSFCYCTVERWWIGTAREHWAPPEG